MIKHIEPQDYDEYRGAMRVTRNISLPPELERFLTEQVSSGQYQSASELVREALRLLITTKGLPSPFLVQEGLREHAD